MINKRLIKNGDTKPVFAVVACMYATMVLNIIFIFRLAFFLNQMFLGIFDIADLIITFCILGVAIVGRIVLKKLSAKFSHKASSKIKLTLRKQIYSKILRLGSSYSKDISTADVIQISTEGVDQLETYFGNYLPQFFYCMLAPITLFIILAPINIVAAFVLFVCVPLIPVSIVIIQKIAKKLLAEYWGLYTQLGDNFLENVQGMTTLKVYAADEKYHKEMNKSAEHFRRITMKVLSMQLNSIIVMDTVAYGGTALGAILAITALSNGDATLYGAIVIILLASEFFLPMRMLGSFFHIAMNGMSAADKMFSILDMKEPDSGEENCLQPINNITFNDVGYSYDDKQVLKNISFSAVIGLTAFVGMSGSGKSTIAGIIAKDKQDYSGDILIENTPLKNIAKESLFNNITSISDKSYVFSGTVRENLLFANENATDEMMIEALKSVKLWDFLNRGHGLDTQLTSGGTNFSGGQRGRLCIARALLRNSQVYIFDEVTSNIDADSENDIIEAIYSLSKTKIVFLISHRLANVVKANQIVLLKDKKIADIGTHDKLIAKKSFYGEMYAAQQELEQYGRKEA